MNASSDKFKELGRLLATLCDGRLTPESAARLEQLASQSDESRRFFLNYVQLHGELHWDNASGAVRDVLSGLDPFLADRSGAPAPAVGRRLRVPPVPFFVTAAAAAALVMFVGWWSVPRTPVAPDFVARLTGSINAAWSGSVAPGTVDPGTGDTRLAAGLVIELEQGLVEIAFDSGAKVIIEAPARFEPTASGRGLLHSGRLTANVPREAVGFAIDTPNAAVVDLGTEFGLFVPDSGASEVHVFTGRVEVSAAGASGGSGGLRAVASGEAVSVLPAEGGAEPSIKEIAMTGDRFVRSLPRPGSVADFRALVSSNKNLFHHYTFEGRSRKQKCSDKHGNLDLSEVVMADGRGGGSLEYSHDGFDATTNAVRPFRALIDGNTNGVSLQSEGRFMPPESFTVELLLTFNGLTGLKEGAICAAVATRDAPIDCGFLTAAVGENELVHLMNAEEPWVQSGLSFIPGDWYYVASTFQVIDGQTVVNCFAANLSEGERTLRQVVDDAITPGTPAASRLGVGKAFDWSVAHAYPWAGSLDEVALYDAALDLQTLQGHLRMLLGSP